MCPLFRAFHRSQALARAVTHAGPLPTFCFDVQTTVAGRRMSAKPVPQKAEGTRARKGKGEAGVSLHLVWLRRVWRVQHVR